MAKVQPFGMSTNRKLPHSYSHLGVNDILFFKSLSIVADEIEEPGSGDLTISKGAKKERHKKESKAEDCNEFACKQVKLKIKEVLKANEAQKKDLRNQTDMVQKQIDKISKGFYRYERTVDSLLLEQSEMQQSLLELNEIFESHQKQNGQLILEKNETENKVMIMG